MPRFICKSRRDIQFTNSLPLYQTSSHGAVKTFDVLTFVTCSHSKLKQLHSHHCQRGALLFCWEFPNSILPLQAPRETAVSPSLPFYTQAHKFPCWKQSYEPASNSLQPFFIPSNTGKQAIYAEIEASFSNTIEKSKSKEYSISGPN